MLSEPGSVFRDPGSDLRLEGTSEPGSRNPDPDISESISASGRRRRRQVRETGAHGIERGPGIRGSVDPKHCCFTIDGGVPVAWIGVIAEPLRTVVAALLLKGAEPSAGGRIPRAPLFAHQADPLHVRTRGRT